MHLYACIAYHKCSLSAVFCVGWCFWTSLCTPCTHAHTHPPTPSPITLTVPSAPQVVTVTPINSTSLHVTWRPPATPNGQPRYVVYYSPSLQSNMDMSLERPFDARSADIVNLAPYTNYSIEVAAKTSCAETRSMATINRTSESIPTPVRDLTVSASLPTSVTVHWEPPMPPNGRILHYVVSSRM